MRSFKASLGTLRGLPGLPEEVKNVIVGVNNVLVGVIDAVSLISKLPIITLSH